MDGSAFRHLGEGLAALMVIAAVSVPLALWKLVEIAIWLYRHIGITVNFN